MDGTYDDAFEALIDREGRFTADPRDKGNWTGGKINVGQLKGSKYGVSAATYPDLDIRNLTLDQAKAIYKRDFWDACHAGDFPYEIGFNLFDAAVNSGVSASVKWLQEAVGAYADGRLGPKTWAAYQALPPTVVAARMLGRRLDAMTGMAWATYGKGWARRIAANLIGIS